MKRTRRKASPPPDGMPLFSGGPGQDAPDGIPGRPGGLPPSQIQKASAGTGKTFALSSRYLQLLLAGAAPSSILATTFTRAAAGEILGRVVTRLAESAGSDALAAGLASQLGVTLDRATALRHLVRLMRQIHELRVGTIDSFLHQVARGWSLELGLPAAWNVGETDQLNAGIVSSVQKVLSRKGTDTLLNLLAPDGGKRGVASELQQQVDELYFLFQQAPEQAWTRPGPRARRPGPEAYALLADELEALSLEDGRTAKAVGKDIAAVRAGELESLCDSTILGNVVSGNCTYSRRPLPGELVDVYRRIADLAAREVRARSEERTRSAFELLKRYAEEFRTWQAAQGLLGFDDLVRLVGPLVTGRADGLQLRMDGGVDHLLLDEFQDTSPPQWSVLGPIARRALASGRGTFFCVGDPKQAIYSWRGGVAEMFEVVENELGSWLSPSEPLLTSRRSAQPVIDAVNAVFGNLDRGAWRNDSEKAAADAWRRQFEPHRTVHEDWPGCVRVLRGVAAADADQVPAEPDQSPEESSSDSPVDSNTAIDQVAIGAIRRMAADPQRSVGVLVRRHDDAARLVFRLRQAGIPCSEEGGNLLTDSAPVNVMLAAFSLADHPTDSAAGFLISHSPLGAALDIPAPRTPRDPQFLSACQRASRGLRSRISATGYGAVCHDLGRFLLDQATARDRSRIELLVNLATDFDLRWSPRPSEFVALASDTRIPEPTSAGVRVMTIHKSKGLEFDAVVLPLYATRAGWSSNTPTIIYSRDPVTRQVDRIIRYENEKVRQLLPAEDLAVFDQHTQNLVRESLCLLYVAMTRAIHDLTIVVPEKARASTSNVEGVLLSTLGGEPGDQSDDSLIWKTGDENWHLRASAGGSRSGREPGRRSRSRQADRPSIADVPVPDTADTSANASPAIRSIPDGMPPDLSRRQKTCASGRGMAWIAPSRHVASGFVDGRDLLRDGSAPQHGNRRQPAAGSAGKKSPGRIRTDGDGALQFGRVIHSLFQLVQWMEGAEELPGVLGRLRAAMEGHEESAAVLESFSEMVARPAIAALFSRNRSEQRIAELLSAEPAAGPGTLSLEVRNECPVAAVVDGVMIEGTVDRLVLARRDGRLVAAELIDYKSDRVPESAVEARAAEHRWQVERYIRASAAMLGLPATRIIGRLAFVQAGKVIPVTL